MLFDQIRQNGGVGFRGIVGQGRIVGHVEGIRSVGYQFFGLFADLGPQNDGDERLAGLVGQSPTLAG